MAFLKRISDNFLSYVSPRKTNASLPTPTTEPKFKPADSMDNSNDETPTSHARSSTAGGKRKLAVTPTTEHERPAKAIKSDASLSAGDTHNEEKDPSESTVLNGTLANEDGPIVEEEDNTPSSEQNGFPNETEEIDGDFEEDLLRAKGWDDDYITLIGLIAFRGYDSLFPAYNKFEYTFLPNGLFARDDDAHLGSVRNDHFRSSKAMDKLLEIGGRIRDHAELKGSVAPEEQFRRQLNAYMKWANEDAGFDDRTLIPVVAMEIQPASVPFATMKANAARKCARLAARFREEVRIQRSVEGSPASTTSDGSQISYPLPTFYAIIASSTLAALMAYTPGNDESDLHAMALFDFREKENDFWNAFGLAITVCHIRNVQKRIAEETGIGMKQPDSDNTDKTELDDPDA